MHRKLLSLLALAVTAIAFGSEKAAHGAAHAHPTPTSGGADLRADAAFDADGRLWMVRHRGGFIEALLSEDLGRRWSEPVRVNREPEDIDPGGDARPKVLPGKNGTIFISWTRPLAKPYTGEVRFSRSIDGGRSFEPPRTVHRDRAEITHRFDALALDAEGRLFVAWIDKRDAMAAAATGRPYRGAALYFAVSADGGATFAGDFKAADHTCECCRIALAPAVEGGVHALWRHIFEPNVRDHALAQLQSDGTAGPLRRATFDDWRVNACPHHGPALACDEKGRLHAVWFTATESGGGRAAYGRVMPGASPEAIRPLGGRLAAHADLAVAGGKIVTIWKEFASGANQLRALVSSDNGRSWREVTLAESAGPCSQPRVFNHQGKMVAFWNTGTGPAVIPVNTADSPTSGKTSKLSP
ncbi:MAG: hypothetical protein RJB55_223 [Verrucomicrobiota bacterium]